MARILPCQALHRPLQTQGPLEPESQIRGIRKDLKDFKQIPTPQRELKRLNGAGAPEPTTWCPSRPCPLQKRQGSKDF